MLKFCCANGYKRKCGQGKLFMMHRNKSRRVLRGPEPRGGWAEAVTRGAEEGHGGKQE